MTEAELDELRQAILNGLTPGHGHDEAYSAMEDLIAEVQRLRAHLEEAHSPPQCRFCEDE